MRMSCTHSEIGQTDGWIPRAEFDRPIESFLAGTLVYHEGIDRQDFYRGVFGWVDGLPVALKAHARAPIIGDGLDRRVTLYLSDRIEDDETASACVDLVVGAFGLRGSVVARVGRDGVFRPVRVGGGSSASVEEARTEACDASKGRVIAREARASKPKAVSATEERPVTPARQRGWGASGPYAGSPITKALDAALAASGRSLQDVAAAIGIEPGYLAMIRRGGAAVPLRRSDAFSRELGMDHGMLMRLCVESYKGNRAWEAAGRSLGS